MVIYSATRFHIWKVLMAICELQLFILIANAQQPELLGYNCPNTTTYSQNTTYQANLRRVLYDLSSSNATTNLFFNVTVGDNAPDIVYGLVLCRGDITSDACNECVKIATTEIIKKCPIEKESYIWYDKCMLRYNNVSFFGTIDTYPAIYEFDTRNVLNSGHFDQELGDIMDGSINRASAKEYVGPLKGFATGDSYYTSMLNLFIVVQCTPDLSSSQCYQCLRTAFGHRAVGSPSWKVIYPSCNIRFETYLFYNNNVASPAPPPPVPRPPAEVPHSGSGGLPAAAVVIIVVLVTLSIILFTICFYFKRKKAKTKHHMKIEGTGGNEISEVDSLQYDLRFIKVVTNNFCADNKIGEGGFGEVFKGSLDNGQHIAVKRLSKTSGQGEQEFKNEVTVVAKLQHRNLVRLLGYCLDKEEKILIYEFVPNKSLDFMLFDSRLRIIHRDIKASNVLLDKNMNAMISDFGLARIVGFDESEGSTNRVVGTFGYMSPEYIMHGQFSVKSDVFSFGVLVLEIISGKRNNKFYQSSEHLLSHAWQLWKDGKHLDLVDPGLKVCYNKSEVTRCIHLGLLCVQKDLDERPTMASVLLMLNSSSMNLPIPHEPAFFLQGELMDVSNLADPVVWSANGLSISELCPR